MTQDNTTPIKTSAESASSRRSVDSPFENLQAVEGAVSILGRHGGVMDDDLLDITIERSGYQGGQ